LCIVAKRSPISATAELLLNMSCLGVILQVRGRNGMSTPQTGAAAYSQSHVSRICQGGFPLLSEYTRTHEEMR